MRVSLIDRLTVGEVEADGRGLLRIQFHVYPLAIFVSEDSLPTGLRELFEPPKPLSATSYRDAVGPDELAHIDAAGLGFGCFSFLIGGGALMTWLLALQQRGCVPEQWAGVGEVPPTWRTTTLLVLAACSTLFVLGYFIRELWWRWRLPPGRYGIFLLRDTFVLRAPLRPVRCAVIPRDAIVHIGQVGGGAASKPRGPHKLQYRREDGSIGSLPLGGLTRVSGVVLAARLMEWRG
ncbi:MAG: hypothetical protein ACI9KE_001393 [Polyangiales bacterium]